MTNAQAEIHGQQLVVRLPLWQILVLVGGAATVIFSVWLTTRDTNRNVAGLTNSVTNLSASVDSFADTADQLKERVIRLETKVETLTDVINNVVIRKKGDE